MPQYCIRLFANIAYLIKSNRKLQIVLLAGLFTLINGFNYYQHGIKLVNDSARYIEYASNLHEGFYIDPYNIWYLGYPLVIYVFQFFGTDYALLIAFQYLLSLVAVLALYQTSMNLWKNSFGAFMSSCLYILFIDIAQWNSYVLTESLYASSICFCFYLLSLLYIGKRSFLIYIVAGLVLIFTFFIKPTGIALLGATACVGLYSAVDSIRRRFMRVLVVVVAGLLFLFLVNRMLRHYLVMENYQKGEVIYGITTMPDHGDYHLLTVTPPENAFIPPDSDQPLLKIVSFYFHHPLFSAKLFLAKAFYLLAHVRPYWSWFHNNYSLVILLPCYFFFIRGLKMESGVIRVFAISFCVIQILSVCITSEDWDGRFLIPLLPVIFALGPQGLGLRNESNANIEQRLTNGDF